MHSLETQMKINVRKSPSDITHQNSVITLLLLLYSLFYSFRMQHRFLLLPCTFTDIYFPTAKCNPFVNSIASFLFEISLQLCWRSEGCIMSMQDKPMRLGLCLRSCNQNFKCITTQECIIQYLLPMTTNQSNAHRCKLPCFMKLTHLCQNFPNKGSTVLSLLSVNLLF